MNIKKLFFSLFAYYFIFVCIYHLAIAFAAQNLSNQAITYYIQSKENISIEQQKEMLNEIQIKLDNIEKYFIIGSKLAIYGWFINMEKNEKI